MKHIYKTRVLIRRVLSFKNKLSRKIREIKQKGEEDSLKRKGDSWERGGNRLLRGSIPPGRFCFEFYFLDTMLSPPEKKKKRNLMKQDFWGENISLGCSKGL